MALFKIFKGPADKLPSKKTEGYAYFTEDSGMLYIDIKGDPEGVRVKVNAAGATGLLIAKEEGGYDLVEADQFVKIDDIIDVGHGGTGLTEATANAILVGDGEGFKLVVIEQDQFIVGGADGPQGLSIEEARNKLDVPTNDEVRNQINNLKTLAYTYTLTADGWIDQEDGYYKQSYTNSSLKCGANENVPPIITYTENPDEYSQIERAEATPGTGIDFYTKTKPENQISIIIIDVM